MKKIKINEASKENTTHPASDLSRLIQKPPVFIMATIYKSLYIYNLL